MENTLVENLFLSSNIPNFLNQMFKQDRTPFHASMLAELTQQAEATNLTVCRGDSSETVVVEYTMWSVKAHLKAAFGSLK